MYFGLTLLDDGWKWLSPLFSPETLFFPLEIHIFLDFPKGRVLNI